MTALKHCYAHGLGTSSISSLSEQGRANSSVRTNQLGTLWQCGFWFRGSEWGLRICTPNMLPTWGGEANAAGPPTTLWVTKLQNTLYTCMLWGLSPIVDAKPVKSQSGLSSDSCPCFFFSVTKSKIRKGYCMWTPDGLYLLWTTLPAPMPEQQWKPLLTSSGRPVWKVSLLPERIKYLQRLLETSLL